MFLVSFRMRSRATPVKLFMALAYLFSSCFLNIVLVTANSTIPRANFSKNSIDVSLIEQLLGANITEQRTRLAKVAIPHHYDLHYKIYLPTYDVDVDTKYKTEGLLHVEIEVTEATNFIEMHASKLNISKVSLQGDESRSLHSKYVESEKISLSDGQPIAKGLYNLTLMYSGFLELNGHRGIYSDPFISGGKEYASVVTQMQSNSARKMVPCFDEPEYKAVWRITVVHPKGSTAISNGQIISSQEILNEDDKSGPGWMTTKYRETPKMSSYLIALAVGKMDFIEGKARNRTFPMRVYGRPEDVPDCRYLLEIAIKTFDYFEQRFQTPCPLRKLDFFVPQGYDHGGMENWGLVMVNKKAALFNGKNHRVIAAVAAHEIAHMWFGNLVTMKWWNEFWLSEGLATLMTNDALQFLDRGFKQNENHIINEEEGFNYPHPLVREMSLSDEMRDISTGLDVYYKGAMVGSMLKSLIGQEAFEEALKAYLTEFSYKNTVSTDFLTNLRRAQLQHKSAAHLDVYEIGMDFITQKYYPVINVTEVGDGHKIEQWRDVNINATTWNGTWNVPLFVYNSGTNGYNITLLPKGKSLKFPPVNEPLPPIINYDSLGVYRVCYTQELMAKIILYIMNNESALTARTRARIVVDCYHCDIELMGDVGILLNTETVYLVRWAILNGLARYKTAHPDQYQTYYSGTVRQQLEDFRINVANNPLNGNLTSPAQAVDLEERKREVVLLCDLEPEEDYCVLLFKSKRKEKERKNEARDKKDVTYKVFEKSVAGFWKL